MTKRQYKNRIKKVRVNTKRVFYIRFRPVAQKLFFPIFGIILLIGILNYERNERGVLEFTNAAVVTETHQEPETIKVSEVAPIKNPTLAAQEIIQKVAQETDTDWRLLWSICQVESHCTADRIGDNGQSFGAFQIHQPSHPGTEKLAFNIEWSARWTAEHSKEYKDNPPMFFKKHNGINKKSNQWYIDRAMAIYQTL